MPLLSWPGLAAVVTGMRGRGFDVELKPFTGAWDAMSYPTGVAHSIVYGTAGADAVVAELLAITHESMAAGTWPRLKACRAHDCEWAFYDRSRNRSGTWCSMAVCGNRAKARNYRRRHGAGEAR